MLKFAHVLELKSGTFEEVMGRTGTREWVRWRAFYARRQQLEEEAQKKAEERAKLKSHRRR